MSPSLLITSTSSVDFDNLKLPVVETTESVNCFGVSEPVRDRVRILLVSRDAAKRYRFSLDFTVYVDHFLIP